MQKGPAQTADHRRRTSAHLLIIAALGVVASVAVALMVTAAPTRTTTETVRFVISGDQGNMAYSPTNITVHADALVTIIITNYDTQIHSAPPLAQQVSGTAGGVAYYQFSLNAHAQSLGQLASSDISHTFSVDYGSTWLNVPVPPAASPTNPSVTTFTTSFSSIGTYTWYCDAMCGSLPMTPPGEMAGYVHVVK